MLVGKSWRNTNIDDGFYALKEKKEILIISESYVPGAFSLNKAPDFVVSTEEEDKTALELKFISDVDIANMIYDRF